MGINNFFQSKFLALSVMVLLGATLVSVLCGLFPWWFRLHFGPEDATYGSMGPQEADMDIGPFWIYKPNKPGAERNHVLMTSLLALDRATNLPVVPVTFRMAQVCYLLGLLGVAVGFGGSAVLSFRDTGSLTGNFGVAIFTLLGAIAQVMAILLFMVTSFGTANEWHMLPLEDPYRVVITTHPTMYLNWAFYIAIIGAGLAVFGAILLIIETLKVCKKVEEIREDQKRHKAPAEWYPDIKYEKFNYANVVRPRPQYPAAYRVLPQQQQQQFFAQPQPMPQAPKYADYQEYIPPPPQPQMSPSPYASREYIPQEKTYVSREVNL